MTDEVVSAQHDGATTPAGDEISSNTLVVIVCNTLSIILIEVVIHHSYHFHRCRRYQDFSCRRRHKKSNAIITIVDIVIVSSSIPVSRGGGYWLLQHLAVA